MWLYLYIACWSKHTPLIWSGIDILMHSYVEGKFYYGSYMDHLLSWWPHRDDKNLLYLDEVAHKVKCHLESGF